MLCVSRGDGGHLDSVDLASCSRLRPVTAFLRIRQQPAHRLTRECLRRQEPTPLRGAAGPLPCRRAAAPAGTSGSTNAGAAGFRARASTAAQRGDAGNVRRRPAAATSRRAPRPATSRPLSWQVSPPTITRQSGNRALASSADRPAPPTTTSSATPAPCRQPAQGARQPVQETLQPGEPITAARRGIRHDLGLHSHRNAARHGRRPAACSRAAHFESSRASNLRNRPPPRAHSARATHAPIQQASVTARSRDSGVRLRFDGMVSLSAAGRIRYRHPTRRCSPIGAITSRPECIKRLRDRPVAGMKWKIDPCGHSRRPTGPASHLVAHAPSGPLCGEHQVTPMPLATCSSPIHGDRRRRRRRAAIVRIGGEMRAGPTHALPCSERSGRARSMSLSCGNSRPSRGDRQQDAAVGR